jgi:hypothetical protein
MVCLLSFASVKSSQLTVYRVSTLILANPKPKHRARTYEKFILLTHHLRRLYNYDTMYAVISGMQETSIHRLASTHALVQVQPGMEREWQGTLKLMDARGGYANHRKALEADITYGRSVIPLLCVFPPYHPCEADQVV